jgi:hypothetical protein
MDRWTSEPYDEHWGEAPEIAELGNVVERLIKMQQTGVPILTPPTILRLFPDHFREKRPQRR